MSLRSWRLGFMMVMAAGFCCAGCERRSEVSKSPRSADAIPTVLVDEPLEKGEEPGVKAEPIRMSMPASEDGTLARVAWDLRAERDPKKIGWPADKGNNKVFSIEGDFNFQLQVKDGKNFEGRVRMVEARRSGGSIEGLEITGQPQGTEAAFSQAKGMLLNLGFGPADVALLERWRDQAKAGDFNNLKLQLKNSYNRVYTVRLVNDGTSEEPWSVGLDVDWSGVCGCEG